MRKLFLGLSLLAIIVLLAFLFLEIPYTIRAKGIVKPVKEWGLYKGSDGTLVNMLEDHISGTLNEYSVMEFQRGDIVQFVFNEALVQNEWIGQGDTIAWVFSKDLQLRLIEKQGDLNYQQSVLRVLQAGEKPEAVQLAREQVELARQELKTQEKITERMEHLYEQELISPQEYELSVNDLMVRKYALEMAESNYEAVLAGEKEEEIGAVRSRINALGQEIRQLEEHVGSMNILSPLSGRLVRQRNPDTESGRDEVIRIADFSNFVVFVPVDAFEQKNIKPGQEVMIRDNSSRNGHLGHVVGIDNSVQLINRRPKIFVSVLLEDLEEGKLFPNMIVDARIASEPLPLHEYIIRMSRVVYQN